MLSCLFQLLLGLFINTFYHKSLGLFIITFYRKSFSLIGHIFVLVSACSPRSRVWVVLLRCFHVRAFARRRGLRMGVHFTLLVISRFIHLFVLLF